MFEMSFNLQEEGALIRKVVDQALAEGLVTEDLADGGKAYKTSEVGDYLVAAILI
jgi:3-isopropylmalate dehydrogenase